MYEEVHAFVCAATDQPLRLEQCGISYCDGSYRMTRRREEPTWTFSYVVKGCGTLRVGTREFAAREGDVFILPGYTAASCAANEKSPWTKLFFDVRGPLAQQLVKLYGLEGRAVVACREVMPRFLQFLDIARTSCLHEEVILPCTLKMHEIIQQVGLVAGRYSGAREEALRLKELIDSRVSTDISIQELADTLHSSRTRAIQVFRDAFGETPHAYLQKKKMAAAKEMLITGTQPIYRIARSLGYDDPHYFCNAFKKATGISPLEYRQNGKKEPGFQETE